MKAVAEMTPVELLSEFCRKREYHEAVAEARAWMATDEARSYLAPADHGAEFLYLRKPGQPLAEVRKPKPTQDQRWTELCTEINRRFTPPRPFTGPYRG